MDRAAKFKEAVKTGLALMLVYGIALKVNWMNPYWAAWAVAMISLSTAGESMHKGMLRLAGTIPGCIAALVILSLAPQSRWLFLLLSCTWVFFVTYMMLVDKQRSYFWNVAGFVCLIILVTGPSSSANLFAHAMFRTIETAMGVVVYTLVSVFLWPRTNLGAIKKAGGALVVTQAALFQGGWEMMTNGKTDTNMNELQGPEMQQLAQFDQALQAEGSESYEVREMRREWNRFQRLSVEVMDSLNRWQTGTCDLGRINLSAAMPDLPTYYDELCARFTAMQQLLSGKSTCYKQKTISLVIDHGALKDVKTMDLAALAVTRQELMQLEMLTRSMLGCVEDIMSDSGRVGGRGPETVLPSRSTDRILPTVDPENLRGAVFVTLNCAIGFLVWIYIDPPGHTGWFQFTGTVAMAVASMQQIKATLLAKSIGLASAIGLLGYVFIMPHLSTFLGLGLLLFSATFVVCCFFSGLARLAGLIAIINELSVSNPQNYNFAAMANGLLFTVLAILFVFVLSYMLRSPRPEKAVLHLVNRFFRSADFLISRLDPSSRRLPSFITRCQIAFHRKELQTLPGKITAWSRAIDRKHFPANTPKNVQNLVISLQTLGYRLDDFQDAGNKKQATPLIQALNEDILAWKNGVKGNFLRYSQPQDIESVSSQQANLAQWLQTLEGRIEEVISQTDTSGLDPEDGQNFLCLLGSIRGVTTAAVGCVGAASIIDWREWHEEMF